MLGSPSSESSEQDRKISPAWLSSTGISSLFHGCIWSSSLNRVITGRGGPLFGQWESKPNLQPNFLKSTKAALQTHQNTSWPVALPTIITLYQQCCWSPCVHTAFSCLLHLKHRVLRNFFMNYKEPLLPHWLYIWIWSSTPKQSSEHKPLWITRRWPSDHMPQIIMHLGVNSTKFWKRHTGTVKKEKVRFSFSEKQIFKKAQHPNTFYFSYTV